MAECCSSIGSVPGSFLIGPGIDPYVQHISLMEIGRDLLYFRTMLFFSVASRITFVIYSSLIIRSERNACCVLVFCVWNACKRLDCQ